MTLLVDINALVARRGERDLFVPLSLQVGKGELIEITGPNGAGKTTLLRTLAGIHTQFSGSFECASRLYQGHRIGLDGLLSAVENLRWFGHLAGQNLVDEQLRSVITQVGMEAAAQVPCNNLSQGQQRRVAMARWLSSPAHVWLLDEPFTSLDVAGQALLNQILKQHCASGGVVICATHVPVDYPAKTVVQLQVAAHA